MKSETYILKYKYGKRSQDEIKEISKLRVAGKVVKSWYEGAFLCYEIKK